MNTERPDDALPPGATSGPAGTHRRTERALPGDSPITRRGIRGDVAAEPDAGVLGDRRR